MSNNKIVLLLFLLCFGFIESVGQNSRFKDERRIYLWDVTLSMKGYQDKTPDIYDEVIDAIEQDVNTLNDENTEIWVIPFQNKILDKSNIISLLIPLYHLSYNFKKFLQLFATF